MPALPSKLCLFITQPSNPRLFDRSEELTPIFSFSRARNKWHDAAAATAASTSFNTHVQGIAGCAIIILINGTLINNYSVVTAGGSGVRSRRSSMHSRRGARQNLSCEKLALVFSRQIMTRQAGWWLSTLPTCPFIDRLYRVIYIWVRCAKYCHACMRQNDRDKKGA